MRRILPLVPTALLALIFSALLLPIHLIGQVIPDTHGPGGDSNHAGPVRHSSSGPLTTGMYHAKTSYSGWVRYHMYDGFSKGTGSILYGSLSQYIGLHGWARFDLTAIPHDASITGTELRLYQASSEYYESPGVLARVVLVRDATAPAEILYGHVSTGTLLSDRATCYDGWNQIGLYEVSHAAVESCLTQGYIDMGIQSGSTRCSGEAYGYTGPTDLKAFLLVTFTTETQFCDLCALDARLASFPSRTSEQETVRLTALHSGDIQPESVMAYLDLNGAVVDSEYMRELGNGDTLVATLTFRAPATEQKARVSCFTSLAVDPFRNNDTASFDRWVFPAYTTAAVDFEPDHFPAFPPAGWAVFSGGDTFHWMLNPIMDPYAHTGR